MYIPKHFNKTEKNEINKFIQSNAFGQITSLVDGRLFSTHIPFLLNDNHSFLSGHMAKQNPQWQSLEDQEVLITIQGPHNYISPSWYVSPGVPTWNYQAVHIYGTCKVFHDVESLKVLVDSLAHTYESQLEQPWEPDYKASMLKAIVGFELEITEIQCKFKLSQNRSYQDQQSVINALELSGSHQLAEAMKLNN